MIRKRDKKTGCLLRVKWGTVGNEVQEPINRNFMEHGAKIG